MSNGFPILGVWLFLDLTVICQLTLPFRGATFVFKIWPWKSKVGIAGEVKVKCNKVGSTFYWHTSLQSHVNCHPTPGIQLFQIYTSKFQGQGHNSRSHSGSKTLLTHAFAACQLTWPFVKENIFKIWHLKSKAKIMGKIKIGEVKLKSHKVAPTSYRFASLSVHVNRSAHSLDTTLRS